MKSTLNLFAFICLLSFSHISAQDTTVTFTSVISSPNITFPIQLTHAGDGTNRVFVAEQGGRIRVFNKSYVLYDTLITITGMGTSSEQGMLSVVFHPDFKNNGYFFVFH
ncbi:MAG: PQQ-dependent sugar dehydrogenase, partial [Saprospiraceae bacterium]|nr:PQQ-dependent sugar dehydrogenase [Saprospiraceae bacterium]